MIENIPPNDGYYWLMLGDHTMNRVYIWPKKKYTMVKLSTNTDAIKPSRHISFLESNGGKSFTLKYFIGRAKFGEFIKIMNPNEEI